MFKSLIEVKAGDKLTHYESEEIFTLDSIIPKEELEGANYYFPKLGYVRDVCMRKMFKVDVQNKFLVN